MPRSAIHLGGIWKSSSNSGIVRAGSAKWKPLRTRWKSSLTVLVASKVRYRSNLSAARHLGGRPESPRSRHEDAAACIAQAMKQDLREFDTNRAALRVVCASLDSPGFYDPF